MKITKKICLLVLLYAAALAMTLVGKNNFHISNAATDTLTRGQWVHNLVTTFDMTLDEISMPDNYYADIKEGETYYEDIMLATGYGVIDLEAGKNFNPDEAVTREFAVHTLNFCLGYELDETSEYSFLDYDVCEYPEDDQIALNRGWIKLSGEMFMPQQLLTESESAFMLKDAKRVLADSVIDTEYENVWNVKSGVVEVPKNTDVVLASDVVIITDCPVTIRNNDIFVVYSGEIAIPYKAVSISATGTTMSIQTEEVEYEEAFTDIAAQGIIDPDSLIFEAAEGVELTDLEDDSTAFNNRIVNKVKDKKFKKDCKLSNGVTVTVEGTIKNIRVEFQAFSATKTALAKVSCDISITDQIKVVPSSFGNVSLELLNVGIPGLGGLTVNAEIKAAGTMSATVNQHVEIGISCSKSEGIRAIRSFKENGGSNSTISAEASMGVRARLGITGLKVLSGYVYADAGITGKFIDTVYNDGKTPVNCRTFLAYLYADYGASAGCSFLNYEYKNNVEIFNLENSPIRVYRHYEDGSEVPRCARGETFEYFTKYYSKYFGTGWSKGYGAYGYDDAGEPYQIYEYSLSENDKGEKVATITKYHGNVTNLVIPDELDGYEVVGIGRDAFSDNAYMMAVTIPDSVVKIDSKAFANCSKLQNLNIGDTVSYIGDTAFQNCSDLKQVSLSKGLEEMGYGVFEHCISLTEIEIPKSLTKSHICYDNLDVDYTGPFKECSRLKKITFEKGIKQIASHLFAGCTGIEQIEIPSTVTMIDSKAFGGCKNLLEINVPDSVTKINSKAFVNCSKLQNLNMADNVSYIGDAAFQNCSDLEQVSLSKSLEEMGYGVFENCISLTEIEIPKSLTKSHICYDNLDTDYTGPFKECSRLKKITFEKGTKQIASHLFAGCTGIEQIEIPNTVTLIDSKAFGGCKNLLEINVPDSVTKINSKAFVNCSKLQNLNMGDNVSYIGDAAFRNCSGLEQVSLSKSLEEMGYGVFENCISLTEIEIPKSLTKSHICYDNLDVDYTGPFKECSRLKKITFEKGIKQIASHLFAGCTGIEQIEIPNTVTLIDNKAFGGCENLIDVTIPDSVTKINRKAFADCIALEGVDIPSSVVSIGTQLFADCTSMNTVHIPNNWTCLSDSIFEGCKSLVNVNIPETMKTISYRSFRNCTSLKKITIPSSVVTIDRDAFSYCENLSEVILEEGVLDIGLYAFEYCKSLKTITLPDSVRTIGNGIFQKCELLSEIKLGAGVKEIPEFAFYEDAEIKKIIFPHQITKIGKSAFANCTGLGEITINRNVEEIGKDAFSYPAKLTIYGVENTYAQVYANENSISFIPLNVPAQGLKLSKTECQLIRGNTIRLTAGITPEDSSDELTWTSGDESIVTVDSTGLIKGVKTGKTNVFAMIGSIIKTCEVTVYEPVTRVSLNATAKDMSLDETFQLETAISPSNASNQNVRWSSGDESIATVDQTGLVRAIAFGTTEITVTTEDQNKSAVCKITVKPIGVIGVTLNKQSLTIKEGTIYQLEAVIAPENAANQKVIWSSSDPTVVSVENGLLTAVKKGKVVIAVKTEDGGKTAICNVTVADEGELEPTEIPTSTLPPIPTTDPVVTPVSTPTVTPISTMPPGTSASEKPNNDKVSNKDNVSSTENNYFRADDMEDVTSAEGSKATIAAPAQVQINSAKNNKSKKILVKWKKLKGVNGYQIQYSQNRKFKGQKSKNSKGTSITLTGLAKKKIYYVRIRAYKTDGSKKVYGKWSKIKKIEIRK